MSIPDHIGRYRVDRHLGSGAFATVWLAHDDALHAAVAIKVLADNWSHRLDLRQRFVDEARLLRRADSDRLVRVFDIGELPDDRPYFVMTYADRGTLADRLEPAGLPPARALRYAVDTARSMTVLHDLGVIHRDLKPSNVLFRGDGTGERLLVADLGLAKEVAHASGFTVAAGSPGYMAPEQARPGGGLDIRADVYATAAITYHMLTGVPPVRVFSVDMVPAAVAEGVPPPSMRRPGLPHELDAILLRALDPDPARRHGSAAELADELAAVAARPSPLVAGASGSRPGADPAGPSSATTTHTVMTTVTEADIAGPTTTNPSTTGHPDVVAAPIEAQTDAAPGAVAARSAATTGAGTTGATGTGTAAATGADATGATGAATADGSRTGGRSRRARRIGVLVAALVGLLALGGGAVALAVRPVHGPVRVADATGTVSVEVPADWAGQIRDSGWDPGVIGGPHGHGPGLVVAADLDRWRETAPVPGVFVGASAELADVPPATTRIVHEDCTEGAAERYRHDGLTGVVHVWRHCGGTSTSYRDVVLVDPGHYGVFVQIKQAGGADRTTTILDSIRVSPRR